MDQKISQLSSDSSPSSSDLLPIVNVGASATQKMTLSVLASFLASLSQTLTNKTITSPTITGSDSGTETVSNKRITKRVVTVTQSATPSINTDNTDIASITGLAQAITSMSSGLTGTPNTGDLLMIQITDNGTPRAITWGASFVSTTITLPTTTVASTLLRIGFQWNGSVWQCIASC